MSSRPSLAPALFVLLAAGLAAAPAYADPPSVPTMRVQASPDTSPKLVEKLEKALRADKLAECLKPDTFGRVEIFVDEGGARVRGAKSDAGACLEKAVSKAVSAKGGPMRAGVEVVNPGPDHPAAIATASRVNMSTGAQEYASLVAPALKLEVLAEPGIALVELSSEQAEAYLECVRPPILRDERPGLKIAFDRQGDLYVAGLEAEVRLDRCATPVLKGLRPAPVAPQDARMTWTISSLPLEGRLP